MDEVTRLIEKLTDKDEYVRRHAAVALGKVGDANAVPTLIQALKDESEYVRRYVAEALGKVGDATAIPFLIQALKDESEYVQRYARGALDSFDSVAVPALIQALKDKHPVVRSSVLGALRRIASSDPTPGLRAALKPLHTLRQRTLNAKERARYQEVLEQIEKAMAGMKDLPVVSATAVAPVANLPRPAEMSPSKHDTQLEGARSLMERLRLQLRLPQRSKDSGK